LPDAKLLGDGESEVIWVTLEIPGGVAVLDEVPARRVAGQLGIAFTGAGRKPGRS
jgi:predicted nucleic acid-binding protein